MNAVFVIVYILSSVCTGVISGSVGMGTFQSIAFGFLVSMTVSCLAKIAFKGELDD